MIKEMNRQFWFESDTEIAKVMKFIDSYFNPSKLNYSQAQCDDMTASVIESVYKRAVNSKKKLLDGIDIQNLTVLQPIMNDVLKAYIYRSCQHEISRYGRSIGAYRRKTKEEKEADSETETIQLFQEEYSTQESGFDETGSATYVGSNTYCQPERDILAEDLFIKMNSVFEIVLKSYADERQKAYLSNYFWYKAEFLGLNQDKLAEAHGLNKKNANSLRSRFKEKLSKAVSEVIGVTVDSCEVDDLESLIKSLSSYINLEEMQLTSFSEQEEKDIVDLEIEAVCSKK